MKATFELAYVRVAQIGQLRQLSLGERGESALGTDELAEDTKLF